MGIVGKRYETCFEEVLHLSNNTLRHIARYSEGPLSFSSSLPPYLPPSLPPYLPTSLPPNLPTSLPPYLPTSLPPNLPTPYLPTSLPPSLPTSPPPSLPPYLPTFLPPYFTTSLPPYLPTALSPQLNSPSLPPSTTVVNHYTTEPQISVALHVYNLLLVSILTSNLLCTMKTMTKVFRNYFLHDIETIQFVEVGRVLANKILICLRFTPETDDDVSHLIKAKLKAAIPYVNVVVVCALLLW